MSEIDTDLPAFPEEFGCEPGMTLRDYFAAKAMQAIVSDKFMIAELGFKSEIAGAAYEMADEMLKARNEK